MGLLAIAVSRLNGKVIKGLQVNADKLRAALSDSLALVTYLAQHIGHEKASQIYLRHTATKRAVRDIILGDGFLTEAELRDLLAPEKVKMIGLKK